MASLFLVRRSDGFSVFFVFFLKNPNYFMVLRVPPQPVSGADPLLLAGAAEQTRVKESLQPCPETL